LIPATDGKQIKALYELFMFNPTWYIVLASKKELDIPGKFPRNMGNFPRNDQNLGNYQIIRWILVPGTHGELLKALYSSLSQFNPIWYLIVASK